ncbi:hypothetical protein Dalk_3364 [Desulfatibacillum aliphaticivorans]|uniref:Uncharacterized protein n=1 Tax=Desulfatibacillum aliphaticivorans TaxID=218208 RepID=B8FLA7_DESAL|nr:hypothetical protein Dalk_3364 [Desulfatibacillum aliphaticivorans]
MFFPSILLEIQEAFRRFPLTLCKIRIFEFCMILPVYLRADRMALAAPLQV